MNPFQDYFLDVIKNKYAEFHGRARRSEYWFFILFKWVTLFAITTVGGFLGFLSESIATIGPILIVIFYLGMIIPTLAVTVRRLHDSGNSGWMLLLQIIPAIGAIVILIFTVTDSQPHTNQWGPNPKLISSTGDYNEELIDDHLLGDDLV